MDITTEQPALQSRVLETKLLKWKDFLFIQPKNFKDLLPEASDKLKKSILSNQFTQPFYVWYDQVADAIYCLDGYHRVQALLQLEESGHTIPEALPSTFIHCQDNAEAAKLVLQFSSIYAKISETGLYDFMEMYSLDFKSFNEFIDLPSIDLNKFNGDNARDFSLNNHELDIDSFTDEVIMKFQFSKEDYLAIKKKLKDLQDQLNLSSPEEVLKTLLA